MLESTQRGDLDITRWLDWFPGCLDRAFDITDDILAKVLLKAHFWKEHVHNPLNLRQRTMLNRLLGGFEGNVTCSNWVKIATCSPDTALRDIN